MTKTEMILKVIEDLGYKGKADDVGDVMVRYQMKTIYFMMGDEDEPYIAALYPQFSEIEEGEETLTLAVCNKVTREVKLAKVYIDQTFKSVTASCEFFYTDEDSLRANIEYSLRIMGVIRSAYNNTKAELSE